MTPEAREFTRVAKAMERPCTVFVFGSNLSGRHGAGAAKTARERYGAVYGIGEGLQGRSYALPTKDASLRTLDLEDVRGHVARFLAVARASPDHTFVVTRVGCGLAGHSDREIAPLFAEAPENCLLPTGWRDDLPL